MSCGSKIKNLPKACAAVVYSIATNVEPNATDPRTVSAEYRSASQCTIMDPGCMIQALIFKSEILIPREPLINALRLSACPRNASQIVTYGNSIVLVKNALSKVAVDGTNDTCLQIDRVGHAYHNYQQWITQWTQLITSKNETSSQLQKRPQPTGSLWDNTTVTGSWVNIQDIATLSKKHGRMVNNITMEMPHGGIPAAAMNAKNKLKQSTDISGEEKYNIEASVPSPAINVLHTGMTKEEFSPPVYAIWPGGNKFNTTTWNTSPPDNIPSLAGWKNRTVVDSLFEFGPKHSQTAPIFRQIPTSIQHNPQHNRSLAHKRHLPPQRNALNKEHPYAGVRACSTKHSADNSGAFLSTDCENASNGLQYDRRQDVFYEDMWDADWKNIASDLMPRYNKTEETFALDPNLPSIAEALAVMAGSTLLLSSQNAPFVPFWNYSGNLNVLPEPVYQIFNASIQAVGYASGGTEQWWGMFYVILVFAFLASAVCLVFMVVEERGRQVTDFTEPQNLFALAVNSPQTSRLEGAW
ncbi:hypothetical protein PDIDSM_976 [Penicillium digitatum]|nr:hypothetical protein PDIDSM_976 [Penicillium digitatum]